MSTLLSSLTHISLMAIIAICMSAEQKPNRNRELKPLTQQQEELSRGLFVHKFRRNYYLFQEFEESSILFQTDLTLDSKERYAVILPHNERNYIIRYENLDDEFVSIIENDLENPTQLPINFWQTIVLNRWTADMPVSLKDYFGRSLLTFETVYSLKPTGGRRKAVWQTVYFDPTTHNPIAERWEGIIEGQRKT